MQLSNTILIAVHSKTNCRKLLKLFSLSKFISRTKKKQDSASMFNMSCVNSLLRGGGCEKQWLGNMWVGRQTKTRIWQQAMSQQRWNDWQNWLSWRGTKKTRKEIVATGKKKKSEWMGSGTVVILKTNEIELHRWDGVRDGEGWRDTGSVLMTSHPISHLVWCVTPHYAAGAAVHERVKPSTQPDLSTRSKRSLTYSN